MISIGILWNMPGISCICRTHEPKASVYSKKIQMTSGMFYSVPKKALHNYFIPYCVR